MFRKIINKKRNKYITKLCFSFVLKWIEYSFSSLSQVLGKNGKEALKCGRWVNNGNIDGVGDLQGQYGLIW